LGGAAVTFVVAPDDPVFVAGHRGLVGSAIVRRLEAGGHRNLLTANRQQVDLRDQAAVNAWMDQHRPRVIYLVAGTVGGILANSTRPAEFLYDNLMIHANVIEAARQCGVEKLLYLGSSCIYPRLADQPIVEPALLTGPLEPTNEAYAVAKIAGIKMCDAYRAQYGCNFISAMPTNLYGPNDNFDPASSHVLPALIRKFDDALRSGDLSVTVWGSGRPRREFLHVDDLADACTHLVEHYDEPGPINVGFGDDVSIGDLAGMIRSVIHPESSVEFDTSKPDGTPRKLLDSTRLRQLGWEPSIPLAEGIASTYEWYSVNVLGTNL
jgi:GDP-L-fucose synthase